jgi:malonyl-CoA O-methyltransferase
MLSYAQTKYSNEGICWLCADAESLPVQSRSQSLVFSNFALQWCDQLDKLAAEIYRVLEPNGQLLLAVPGPRTLIELRQAWADIDKSVHVNRFASLESWQGALAKAGFSQIDLETSAVTEQHQSVRQLLLELKNVGAHNNNAGRAGHLTGKQRLQALYNAYEQYRLPNAQLPATWEIIVGTARK